MKKTFLILSLILFSCTQLLAGNGDDRFKINNLKINNTHSEIGATYLQHGRVVFASTRPSARPAYREWKKSNLPFYDMFISNIVDTVQLDEPQLLAWDINHEYNEGPATFSADGEFMVFTSTTYDSEGVKRLKLVSSVINSKGWGAPVELPFNNISYSVGHPTLSYDGRTMYFASDMPGGFGGVDLYKVSRTVEGVWGYPENLGANINTKDNDMFPFVHNNGLLFFASNGRGGLGGLDVFVANLTAGSSSVEALPAPINSAGDDFSFILAENQKTGFFSSNREGGQGDDDLYSFTNNEEFQSSIILKGVITDAQGMPLSGTTVLLKDEQGNIVATSVCDADCPFNFNVEPGKKYTIEASKEGYFTTIEEVSVTENDKVIERNIKLPKAVKMALIGRVTDKGTGNPIPFAKVTVFDNSTKKKEIYTSDANGSFRHLMNDKKLGENAVIDIKLEADKYLSVTRTYRRTLDREGDYDLNLESNMKMDKIQTGITRLEDLVDLNPIYYDLASAEIRLDAALELDKIVSVMNINPTMEIELGSHTDARGGDMENQTLSHLRAENAAEYIKMRISNPSRIYGKGYGETKPLNKCKNGVKCSEEEHQKNRRTEFKIIKM
jgi:outer membrane protein OmpA-like peptidoglycan-associated protein